ncbi:hypothetical protein [Poseidonocella sp. HB161398]|uniref:hypothetical protein n=1 Tax=Poseidonocella sp. HB161398 TaxID=2320855 RepID=UPI0019809EC4|nr:hypothetical protein [Poseidonocella sp. HB161398]
MLDQCRRKFAGGLDIGGTTRPVEIIVKDSQSNSNHASTVAQELIFQDEVDILAATATLGTTNPVAGQAELNGESCITNDIPGSRVSSAAKAIPNQGSNTPAISSVGSRMSSTSS